ncbi:MAG: sigma-70 family RNA polymerase sigma factor [Deltaproteobacteria bacterium]|nr:sigma-70 family RNA polymerase sigma factor [Deltaproteobacteria bacterium]
MAPPRSVRSFARPGRPTGDDDAWAQLLAEQGPRVYGLCRRLDPDPDDAYQAIWEKVLRGLHRFDPTGPSPLRSWIMTVAHRHLVDRHRRRTVRGVVLSLAEPPEALARELDPESSAVRNRAHQQLDAALAQLPEPGRRVVVLHHIHGLDLSTIAQGEGVAIGTVKSRLSRARARLHDLLPADLFGDS